MTPSEINMKYIILLLIISSCTIYRIYPVTVQVVREPIQYTPNSIDPDFGIPIDSHPFTLEVKQPETNDMYSKGTLISADSLQRRYNRILRERNLERFIISAEPQTP